jgi:MOSC domain-containing protein YiiM
MQHRTTAELEAGLPSVADAPRDRGQVSMIVRRPAIGEREVLDTAELDLGVGLVGDTWTERPSREMPDGSPHPERQITIMNVRAVALMAGDSDRWPLAGDQFYVDLDIGVDNLPAGTQVRLGDAVVEITAAPHNGCAKFTQRFGLDAMHFVNSPTGKHLRLRGANARVLQPGVVCPGDAVVVDRQAQPPA